MIRLPVGLKIRDGQEKWICDRAFPIRDATGQLIRVAGIAEEITERKRHEAELILAREGVKRDGSKIWQRMVFKNISANEFDWSWESSTDGKSWTVQWPIHYKRRAS